MKKLVLVSSLLLTFSIATAEEGSVKEDLIKVKDDVAHNIQEGWSATKDKASELSHDAKEGLHNAGDSIKNSIEDLKATHNVSDEKTLTEYLEVEVVETENLENNTFAVKVQLKNLTDKPVKFDALMGKTDLITLNEAEIAHFATDETYKNARDLEIPANSTVTVDWVFKDADSKPVTLRVFDVHYPLTSFLESLNPFK